MSFSEHSNKKPPNKLTGPSTALFSLVNQLQFGWLLPLWHRGLYIPDQPCYPVHFRGLNVRIEDSVCVQDEHAYVLTTEAVKEVCVSVHTLSLSSHRLQNLSELVRDNYSANNSLIWLTRSRILRPWEAKPKDFGSPLIIIMIRLSIDNTIILNDNNVWECIVLVH